MTAKKNKVTVTTACKDGKHVFIVTAWNSRGGQQKASMVRCQHCLLPLDMDEIESREWQEAEGML